jgi:hypothetical protein
LAVISFEHALATAEVIGVPRFATADASRVVETLFGAVTSLSTHATHVARIVYLLHAPNAAETNTPSEFPAARAGRFGDRDLAEATGLAKHCHAVATTMTRTVMYHLGMLASMLVTLFAHYRLGSEVFTLAAQTLSEVQPATESDLESALNVAVVTILAPPATPQLWRIPIGGTIARMRPILRITAILACIWNLNSNRFNGSCHSAARRNSYTIADPFSCARKTVLTFYK